MNTITERALIGRINRRLSDSERVRACPWGSRGIDTLGRHYLVDWHRNVVLDTHVDLEYLGRELGALADHERLEAEGAA
jgi:hypothetical protein